MNTATILAEENWKLRAANHRWRQRQDKRRQYTARGGALKAEQGRALAPTAYLALAEAGCGGPTRPESFKDRVYDPMIVLL
jgi:hypothetical protein